ncbi:MAG: hypothetical protein MOGMAGMI_00505 [Candidatus Omnitrophica bacterium]|nr:hypothetical protein [Candidatus Omnitrophota bacterium]
MKKPFLPFMIAPVLMAVCAGWTVALAATDDLKLTKNVFTAYPDSDYGSLHVAAQVGGATDLSGKLLMVAVRRGDCADDACRETFQTSIFGRAELPEGRYFAAIATPEGGSGVYGVRMGGFLRSAPVEGVAQTSLQGWVFVCDDKESAVLPPPAIAFTVEPGLTLPEP